MAVTASDVVAYAPEFDPIDDARIDVFIAYAIGQLSSDFYGTNYDLAVILLTCHMLSMAGSGAGGSSGSGLVTSERVGDLQRTFSVPAAAESGSALGASRFGIELERLTSQYVVTPFMGY